MALTLPLIAILPPPKPPCTSMLPGSPRIQPSNEPAVPVSSSGVACGAENLPSSCSGWLGACDLKVAAAISSTTGGRPCPSAMVSTEVADLDRVDPREGGRRAQPERPVLAGMRARAVGRRQHVEVGVAHLVALDQDVGAFEQDAADLDLAQEQRRRVEEQGELAHPREVRARAPARIGEGDALGHHGGLGAELDGERHAGGKLAAGHLADLLGHADLETGKIARADPNDPGDRGDGQSRRENPGQPLPGNAHYPPILAQTPSNEKPNASTVRRK